MRKLALILLGFAGCGSCGSKDEPAAGGGGSSAADVVAAQQKEVPQGLDVRLSDGKQGPPPFDRGKLAPATKLADGEIATLLARAQPIATDPDDGKAFALRPGSQPAPRTGTVVTGKFPPESTVTPPVPAPGADAKELRVLRYMPEGEVPIAPELTVTFSQPMVAVTSQDDAARVQPVKLSPATKGRWRWIGTRTIVFDPDVRFPQATTYTVEIPAGTKSATGAALDKATKFTFETPPPTVVGSFPFHQGGARNGAPQRLDAPMFLLFDQKVDPGAILQKLVVKANGGKQVTLKLVDDAWLKIAQKSKRDDEKAVAALVEAAKKNEQEGRFLAFRAASTLPADTEITLEVPPGTPSAEGPNVTKKAQELGFHTFPPLRIEEHRCGWSEECPPGQPFMIRFNNPLDPDKFDEKWLQVSPDVTDVKVTQSYTQISIGGPTKAQTRYEVEVSPDVLDQFGQRLGKERTLTFRVGDARPNFYGPHHMVVLDPLAKKPTLDFFTTNYDNLKVKIYKVTPADYDAYGFYLNNQWNERTPPPTPGTLVSDTSVKIKPTRNELVETSVDLAPALGKDGLGHAVVIVEPSPWTQTWRVPRMIAWVQSTRLGVDAYVDADDLRAFTTDLATGAPLSGVALETRPYGLAGTSDVQGIATIPLQPGTGAKGSHFLVARKGNDVAFVTEYNNWWSETGSWVKSPRPRNLAWYVIDDRKMYKPGEEVSLKGWLRTIDTAKHGDVGGPGTVANLTYVVRDARYNEIAKGTAKVSTVGGFDLGFALPKTPNLGTATIQLIADGDAPSRAHTHAFQIEEFRRPEFEVSAQASQGPFLVRPASPGKDDKDGAGDVTVTAKYYTGGPLPSAPVNWQVSSSQTSYTPPNREDYVFGSWVPWWEVRSYNDYDGGDGDDDEAPRGKRGGGRRAPGQLGLQGKTDATGAHTLHLDFLSVKPSVPMSVVATASVTDVNRQTWSASSAMIVHPASVYVGMKTKKPFVEKDVDFEIDVIAVDLDGKHAPGTNVELKAVRLDWEYKKGVYATKEVDPQVCKHASTSDAQTCKFKTPKGGTYSVVATVADGKGRANQSRLTFWVAGGDRPAAREVVQERVQIIPDKKEYAAGDTAELLVQAPFYPAEAVVSWRRSGIVKLERVKLDGPTKVITVPITEAMVPNLYVQVDLVGATARTDDKGVANPALPKRPAYAVGSINLPVPPKQRTLAVSVAPSEAKVSPRAKATVAVTVVDAAGKPVADAEAAVIVVDEAILALTGYKHPDPIAAFYTGRGPDTRDAYQRGYVKLARPDADALAPTGTASNAAAPGGGDGAATPPMTPAPAAASVGAKLAEGDADEKEAPKKLAKEEAKRDEKPADKPNTGARKRGGKGGAGDDDGGGGAPIAIRSNFNPLAAFSPAVKTDAAGKATIEVEMPDNLTRYRIVAVAVAGEKQFGKGESAITARLPLMVRPSPPRFLNFGDTFRLPVVVQNQTDSAMTVKLAARTTNATLTDGAGREVTVPANDRVEVQFPAAAELAGTARFQIVGSAGAASDAAEVALPVWTPATTEAFGTYGVIDGSGAAAVMKQPVALPGKVVTQFGGIEVTTSSTNLQALTDAFIYLVRYPYECAEQRSSRILGIAALRDVLAAFKTKDLPAPAALEGSVKEDLERIANMQNGDGGFTWWQRGFPSDPYLTVYVTSALGHAQKKGFAVPQFMIDNARPYLRDIERHYPWYYGPEIRRTISSYALYVRKQLGDLDVAKGQQIIREAGGVDKLSMEANGWLLGTFAGQAAAATERAAIVRHATNKVSETAGAANFTTGYSDGAHLLLASNRRVDAVMLESLIQEDPKLDLIPKLVTGLLGHRKAGRWLNTQENTFALLALDLYFQTYEKATPDFVARVWLGDDYAGDHAFKGRSTDYFTIPIAMKDVAAHDKQALTIQKDGAAGRLYYRIGMTYAPASLKLEPADYGFTVQRTYEAVDDAKDVTRDKDGTWRVKAG
ncbi:MAG: Ig-like domain-containing protein, partial [Deltaproteobacteria bacterium]|nr:Ig-like domain-containing protein [Deltaproteobacteria bacterium]